MVMISLPVAIWPGTISWLFSVFVVAMILWGIVFCLARRATFAGYRSEFPERTKHYSKNYQFIRYKQFIQRLGGVPPVSMLERALEHLHGKIETEPAGSKFSQPLLGFIVAAMLAVLGGVSWTPVLAALTIWGLIVLAYFVYMFLDITQTPMSDPKEFKRFLLWAKEEAAGS
jgi:hypothetical protein